MVIHTLLGKWESLWVEIVDNDKRTSRELFEITKQRGTRVYGNITMNTEPDKKWDLEGNFNGRFLQLFWSPSKDSNNKLFLDFGCYFFELKGRGLFEGYGVGYEWSTDIIEEINEIPRSY